MTLPLKPLQLAVQWLDEPELAFANGLTHIDPKVGIPASGPWSRDHFNHPSSVTVGFIGTGDSIAKARAWLSRAAEGVDGNDDHHPFCGFQLAGPFASQLRTNGPEAKITAGEIRDLTGSRLRRLEGLRHLLEVIDNRLMQLASLDSPPTLVIITLPAAITKRYWAVHQMNRGVETVWNLRAGIKARAMQRGLRTQLLQQETIESDLDAHTSDLEHPADLAWNLFTAIYFKSGGFPWAPVGIPEGTCHLGVTFYRPHGERSAMRTSVAQAFAENGEAFVLRGNPFEWKGKWPHLPADEAARLITDVVDRYTQTMKRPPRRLVVHKQSRFFPDELSGFQDALNHYEYDLVALAPSTGVRLMRHGDYPPPRGTCLRLGNRRYLYTTGYIPSLGRYPHGHVPTPVQITDHIGDSAADDLLREVLLLTKMNWNSARFAERLPVTVRFANEVGAILRDLPDDLAPEARYAFYM
ncbi:hypothetical protein F8568_020545 [Actinomadura sp. LD22]|uniref:Protein argonaute n=1 Tax=Actinomadura physcomitrii TaxID=2650748 RepID=A0A6I4MCR3_9ACTN|nr:hypothetical protein [Actinomadura physcomitrii]MWA02720.1 hypothetical protein [Actinomadura physcomitrii]